MYRLLLLICMLRTFTAGAESYYLFIGTYTSSSKSKGIYVYRFDDESGTLQWVSNTAKGSVTNPSYLTLSPIRRYIYACTDTRTKDEGSVSAFSFNNGALTYVNKQPAGGVNPVYVSIDSSGKWLVNANYTSGSVSVFPINSDGSIGKARQVIKHSGAGPIAKRQAAAHTHAAVFSPRQNYLFAPDLGADKIMCYAFNAAAEKPLRFAAEIKTNPGSGPRHFTFLPDGKYAYCVEELGGSITAYSYHNGQLNVLQHISSYQKEEPEYNSADIHTSPDGKFLYASNRNRECNISIFCIDGATGKLSHIGFTNTEGREPRNFIITPSGNFLLVANQLSGNIIVFKRDHETGMLQEVNRIDVPEPSCLQMMKIE